MHKKNDNLELNNLSKAKMILDKLYSLGVRDFVICPGGRNAPFVELLEKNQSKDIHKHWGFEERSASFFALGLAMKNLQPVAVFTTSGTAFVETTSALLEAHYLGLPLIVVSSDRPEYQWGTGAPQTMIQKNFLISHLGESSDHEFDFNKVSFPLHLNCTFDEPLLDHKVFAWTFDFQVQNKFKSFNLNPYLHDFKTYSYDSVTKILDSNKISNKINKQIKFKTLFIMTGLDLEFKNSIYEDLKILNADIYFEATGEIQGHENNINSKYVNQLDVIKNYDLVVRVGGIPTHRIWRDFEIQKFKNIIHFSKLPLPGLSFGEVFKIEDFTVFLNDFNFKLNPKPKHKEMTKVKELISENKNNNKKINNNALSTANSVNNFTKEQLFFKSIKNLDSETIFYIGNSLPIRHWDLFKDNYFNHVYANRGLNGIDGQLSTAIGLAVQNKSKDHKTIAILGDLTTLYDLSAPWYWIKNKSKINFTLIVINNSGGQIFSKMFENELFVNHHQMTFKSFAEMWGLSYMQVNSNEEYDQLKCVPDVIEFKV